MSLFFTLLKNVLMLTSTTIRGLPQRPAGSLKTPENESSSNPQPPELIPRSVLYGNPDRVVVKLSPDGNHISFVAPLNGVLNLWIQSVDRNTLALGEAKPLTYDTNRGVFSYSWTFLEGILLYSQDKGGDENNRLYKVDARTARSTVLTDTKGVCAEVIQTSEHHPDTVIIGLIGQDPRYKDLHWLNLTTGETKVLLVNKEFGGFTFDHNMELRLASKQTVDGGKELFTPILDPNGNIMAWKQYFTIPFIDTYHTNVRSFDSSNQKLYWHDGIGKNLASLVIKDFKCPSVTEKVIFEPSSADIESVVYHPQLKTPLMLTVNYMRPESMYFDKMVSENMDFLQKLTPHKIVEISSSSFDFSLWVVRVSSDTETTAYYLYKPQLRKVTFLFNVKDAVSKYTLTKLHTVEVPTRDELVQVCYFSLPLEAHSRNTGRTTHPVPLVLYVHGGPWARTKFGLTIEFQHMTNRGYAVMSCNFRGSTGYGKRFFSAGFGQWAGAMHNDLIDAVRWAVNQEIADLSRVAISGESYGGYAALVGLTFSPEVFACGVDVVGPSNLITLLSSIPPNWVTIYNKMIRRIGGNPATEEGQKFLESHSPLFKVDQIKKPLLIAHGANDQRVKRQESDQIVAAMKLKKLPVSYLLFPDEGHGFAKPENRLAFQAYSEQFLGACLGGRVEPMGSNSKKSSVKIIEQGSLEGTV